MVTTKQIFLEQFSNCYDRNGWFVAVRNALEGVTAEQAVWKPDGSDNCIWETLSHIFYYNYAYLRRFKGIDYEYTVSSNDETFDVPENASETEWQAEIKEFDSMMSEWRSLLEAADESKFDEPVPQKSDREWWEIIADINTHNAYHGGQILLLRKLHGSWDKSRGVS
ncbi:MAG: DinB family protein [Acidobacteria bacterium]|nr:DinB family protein [Acidobacteriota bacterium]